MKQRTNQEEIERYDEALRGTDLERVVWAYWDLIDRREEGDETSDASLSWRAVRFVGTYDGHTVTDPLDHGNPTWVKRLQRMLREGTLPRTVCPCRPMPTVNGRYKSPWDNSRWVFPEQIDWDGYKHAGGDPERRARSGRSGPTIEERLRKREQVKLSLSEDRATALREAAQRRGLSVSEYVAQLAEKDTP